MPEGILMKKPQGDNLSFLKIWNTDNTGKADYKLIYP